MLEYARRLNRHRKDRHALRLPLSALEPASRSPAVLRSVEQPLRAILKTHEGELFRLKRGDIICIARAPKSLFDEALLKIAFLLRDDPVLKQAIDDGTEDRLLRDFYVLSSASDYDRFLEMAQTAHDTNKNPQPAQDRHFSSFALTPPLGDNSKTAPPKPQMITPLPEGGIITPREKPAPPPKSMDASAFSQLERALLVTDVGRFVLPSPVRMLRKNGMGPALMRLYRVDRAQLAKALVPDHDLVTASWFSTRLSDLLARRLFACDLNLEGRDLQAVILSASIGSLKAGGVAHILNTVPALRKLSACRLVFAIDAADAFADPFEYFQVHQALHDHNLGCALTGYDPLIYAMRDPQLFPSDFDSIDWRLLRLWEESYPEKMDAIAHAINTNDPAQLILDHCDGPDALNLGTGLGFRLFCGPALTS
ncbi:hypothetical protein GCM10007972_05220 [Iodidimonas muriae]|uniref:Uncharacterized protein n=1 Tax=Iodidimonas muriae TaxID=261467 RepID=A0ABQ2L8I0_9PROT|nr:hypothetical protein JCM17843_00530 [Kordiimonadales bacterium JCM 17843]GGO06727.1 hypothetical protein GCM10007972_05220 [Iodidimonas muriae]